ncbi:DUF1326 domain-containing protein [Streptomyces griseosporeus]|uniref:DUF1326 domain-containing protein n=1 Tax=Streptomyces griseosporeus TaxID=1910 RepID=UPI00167D78C2|nr:DUF1326 domain-containing protein [Streptomyces griseosporeus]GHF40730.1 hypothetical protein GCM10018783_06690 [Streptomyces griseosporeus]
MSWTISGNYVAGCSCAIMCSCPFDGKPRDTEGNLGCLGSAVFHIADGNLGDLDLSGVDFAFYNEFPSNLTSGDWKVGLVVDSGASDEQADALERIVSGREGGPFAELSQFYGEYLGTQRAGVSLADGDKPAVRVEGRTELSYEPLTGPDGTPTTVRNALFGFAPEYQTGTTSGSSNAFGLTFQGSYGEAAQYRFSSEEAEGAATGRV